MLRFLCYLLPILLLLLPSPGRAGETPAPRKSHPLAPSLPLLTKEEREKIDAVIDRFIQYDAGLLPPGADGRKILEEFEALGPEATLQLIRGLNRAANMQASCPAVVIGRKLRRLVNSTRDTELLDFAREIIGSGVTAKRHMGVIKDLRVACILRKSYLQRTGLALGPAGKEAPRLLATEDLIKEAGSQHGKRLKEVLVELEKRQGEKVVLILAIATTSKDKEIKQLAGNLLLRHLSRQTADTLKENLKSPQDEVRAASAHVIGVRNLPYARELIGLLDDDSELVRQNARGALVRLSRGQDFGPQPGASDSQRTEAIRSWERWWQQNNYRQ